jgi:hypothetical protein
VDSFYFKKDAAEINLEDKIKECELIGGVWELEEFVGNFADSNDYGEKPNWELLLIHLKNYEDEDSTCKTFMVFLNLDWVTDTLLSFTWWRSLPGSSPRVLLKISISVFMIKLVRKIWKCLDIHLDLNINQLKDLVKFACNLCPVSSSSRTRIWNETHSNREVVRRPEVESY